MNHSVSLICGHSACKECMNTLVKRQASRQKNCPLCRAVIADISFKINVPLNAIISKLDIRCTNNGCTWIGAHHEKAGHQDNCQFLERSCPHGCAGTFFVQSLEEHLRDCQFERVTCQHCLDTSPRYMMRTHEKVCIQRPQDCPLGCGEKFRRSVKSEIKRVLIRSKKTFMTIHCFIRNASLPLLSGRVLSRGLSGGYESVNSSYIWYIFDYKEQFALIRVSVMFVVDTHLI